MSVSLDDLFPDFDDEAFLDAVASRGKSFAEVKAAFRREPIRRPARSPSAVDLADRLDALADVLGSYGDDENETVAREAARRFRAGSVEP